MEPLRVEKPWGNYKIVYRDHGFQVKRIEVNPACRISLQKHAKRSERWTIVKGEGTVVLNDKEIKVKAGSLVEVPLGTVHRITNTSDTQLIFIEVMMGDCLGENDVTRLQDDYNRT